MLSDGDYDVILVDVEPADGDRLRLEMTVLGGEHKGEVLAIAGPASLGDPLALVGLPGVLTVADGEPTLRVER